MKEEFVEKDSDTERAERRLVTYLSSGGLNVIYRSQNRFLDAGDGTIDAIERAFHVRIHNVGFKGRSRHLARSEPSLPARLARSVVGVVGLGDEGELQPHLVPQQQSADLGPTCCALGPPELARFNGT